MIEALTRRYRRLLVRWVDGARRWAVAVTVVAVVAAIGAGVFTATNMRINTDTSDMLSPELPYRRLSEELSRAFPQFSDTILVVIDGDTADLAADAASALAARLRAAPEVFGTVFDAAGDPFFRKNGLLYLDAEELTELADRLAEAQPFLGALWRDPSLRGFFAMLGKAIDELLGPDADVPIEIAGVLDSMSRVVAAQAEGRFATLSWRDLMRGEDDGDATRRFLLIQPKLDFASLQPAATALRGVRVIAAKLGMDGTRGVRVRLTGSAALAHEEMQSVEEGMGLAALLSLSLVVGLLLFGLGSVRLALAILATLVVGLLWAAAFALAAVGQLNLISVAFAVLFIGLSVDFGIHFGLRYKEDVDAGHDHSSALGAAADGVGGTLTLCAVAAAIGFFSFLPTDYLGLAELGLIAGVGMFIALFANLTVLPAILTIGPPAPARRRARRRRGAEAFIRAHARAIAWGALALGLAAAALVPQARFDFDPLNLKDPETESASTLFDLMANGRTDPYSIIVLAPDLGAAAALGERVAALAEVDSVETLLDLVPGGQDEKLDIIADMALFLAPSLADGRRVAAPTADENGAALASLRAKLQRLASAGGTPASAAAARLLAALTGLGEAEAPVLAEMEMRLLSGLPGRLDELRQSLGASPVGLDDLPAGLRARRVTADGRAKLEIYPKGNVHERRALARFVEAVRRVAPAATGSPVVIFEAGNTVVAAFRDAAVLAVVAITLLLAVLLRRAPDVALVFAPLVLAALLTMASSVLLDLPFNFANVIVLPLLFGLGVASGIHLVSRARDTAGIDGAMETSTPRAVVFSALTTIGSFGSIALSSHPGTSSMGTLLTIAIALTLACTLVVLPALMALRAPAPGTP